MDGVGALNVNQALHCVIGGGGDLTVFVGGTGHEAGVGIVGRACGELRGRSAANHRIGIRVVRGDRKVPLFLLAAVHVGFHKIAEGIVIEMPGRGAAGRDGVGVGGDCGGIAARGVGAAVAAVVVLNSTRDAREVDVACLVVDR